MIGTISCTSNSSSDSVIQLQLSSLLCWCFSKSSAFIFLHMEQSSTSYPPPPAIHMYGLLHILSPISSLSTGCLQCLLGLATLHQLAMSSLIMHMIAYLMPNILDNICFILSRTTPKLICSIVWHRNTTRRRVYLLSSVMETLS